jgi:hypothetical protein
MGYEPPSTGLKLDFSDTPYAGLEVTMGAVSLGQILDIEDLTEATGGTREMVTRFADCLESWNVTRGGEPVPADLAGVLSQDPNFILAIVLAWQRNVATAPPPLPGALSSGGTSAEASMPGLASASRSLQS